MRTPSRRQSALIERTHQPFLTASAHRLCGCCCDTIHFDATRGKWRMTTVSESVQRLWPNYWFSISRTNDEEKGELIKIEIKRKRTDGQGKRELPLHAPLFNTLAPWCHIFVIGSLLIKIWYSIGWFFHWSALQTPEVNPASAPISGNHPTSETRPDDSVASSQTHWWNSLNWLNKRRAQLLTVRNRRHIRVVSYCNHHYGRHHHHYGCHRHQRHHHQSSIIIRWWRDQIEAKATGGLARYGLREDSIRRPKVASFVRLDDVQGKRARLPWATRQSMIPKNIWRRSFCSASLRRDTSGDCSAVSVSSRCWRYTNPPVIWSRMVHRREFTVAIHAPFFLGQFHLLILSFSLISFRNVNCHFG